MVEIGKKYGKLLCIGNDLKKDSRYYLFKCECGNICSKIGANVERGATKSCGCYQKLFVKNGMPHKRHGESCTRLYRIWKSMHERCDNPNANRANVYQMRGIQYCNEWKQFESFRDWSLNNGYSDCLTLDRINNEEGYNPKNCRWVTVKEQNNNRRNNVVIEYNGSKRTLSEWAKEYGINYSTLWNRYHNLKWDFEKCLLTNP